MRNGAPGNDAGDKPYYPLRYAAKEACLNRHLSDKLNLVITVKGVKALPQKLSSSVFWNPHRAHSVFLLGKF